MGRSMSATGQFLLATDRQFPCPPTGSFRCPLTEPKLRRAGLDYHDLASVTVHPSLDAAWEQFGPTRVFAFTAHAQRSFAEISYRTGDVLMFGPEPTGLDQATLADRHITEQVRIPMVPGRRSLNLSNAAAVAAYEAWRQQGFSGAV